MKQRIVSALIVAIISFGIAISSKAESEIEFIPMTATGYCLTSPRCDGGSTREGICAVKGHYGEVACVYLKNKDGTLDFYGYFEVLDYCEKKNVIDLWFPCADDCFSFGRRNVEVVFVHGVG